MRRALILLALAAVAGPAAAQDPATDAILQLRQAEQEAQHDLARQRAMALENDLNALDARLKTEQRLRDLEARGPTVAPPPVILPQAKPSPQQASAWPSIPDAALAASRARIAEASRNRR
jgi:hypothetical protein